MDHAGAVAEIELFRSADLLARAVGRRSGDVCVVTFACLLDRPDLAAPGFGEAFFADRGIDAVHVTCSGNDWYQYPDLFAALDAVRAAVRPYRRVLAYGSSMGGYAAVRYGERSGAHEALAISPQFSIDARRAPFETRWRSLAGAIRFLNEDRPPAVGRATVVYDPFNRDARHVALMAAAVPVRPVKVIHAGHPAGAYLAEAGLLSELVLSLCAGALPGDFERRARAARRCSGQYLFTLARRVPRRRAALKLALARRAVAASASDPMYRSYLGLLLDAGGDAAEAEEAHRAAAALAPDNVPVVARLARCLLRHGHAREGAALARTAHRLAPHMRQVRHLLCAALFAEGDARKGIRMAAGGRPHPRLVFGAFSDALRVLAWTPENPGWRLRFLRVRADRLPLHLGAPDEVRAADISPRPSPRAGVPRSRPA